MQKTEYVFTINDLFVDGNPFALNLEETIKTIRPYVYLTKTGSVIFQNRGNHSTLLSIEEKILIFALIRKIINEDGGFNLPIMFTSSFSAQEFREETGLNKSSVDSSFKRLREQGYIVGKNDHYQIADDMIDNIIKRIPQPKIKGLIQLNHIKKQ